MTRFAKRLADLPPYLFAEIDRKKHEAQRAGRDIIDFGVGDPDQPTPTFIVDRMAEAIRDPSNHTYSLGIGTPELREAIADFFVERYEVHLDANEEVVALLGSKEGIGHLPTAVLNPGETVLIPEPGYPVYVAGTIFAGGTCQVMPLKEENGWLPALGDIPVDARRAAKLMFLNYPNNPTGAVAPLSFFEEVVAFAAEYDIIVAHDAPYAELYFSEPPPSILQVPGSQERCIEFHSLSKTFNMTGWRLGFAAGNPQVLKALARVKSNLDSGIFGAVQQAGVAALKGINRSEIKGMMDSYRRRRDALVRGLIHLGWPVTEPAATFYVWAKLPGGHESLATASRLLDEAGVVVVPGAGMGKTGERFVRFSLTVNEKRITEAIERMSKLAW